MMMMMSDGDGDDEGDNYDDGDYFAGMMKCTPPSLSVMIGQRMSPFPGKKIFKQPYRPKVS